MGKCFQYFCINCDIYCMYFVDTCTELRKLYSLIVESFEYKSVLHYIKTFLYLCFQVACMHYNWLMKYSFSHSSVGKESSCNAGDPGLISGSGRSPGERKGYPLQYSWASLVAQLIRKPPTCGRPGFHPWVGNIPWRRERLPTPVFWSGEFYGLYSPWGHRESDTTYK